MHIGYKNAWFFQKFCQKWWWKVQHWIIIHQHFEMPGKFFPKIFRWGNVLNVCNVTETWKKCYKSYKSFHNFCHKRSSKLWKWIINCFNFESCKCYCWSLEIKKFASIVTSQELWENVIKTIGLFISFVTKDAQSCWKK